MDQTASPIMAAIPRAQIEMLNLSSEEVCSVNAELRPFRWIYFYAGPNSAGMAIIGATPSSERLIVPLLFSLCVASVTAAH